MEIRTIDTFLKVAATQNFSKAAEQMGYSQSAVTVQIQKLEKELGVELFERMGKRVYLTETGKAFIPYASDLMQASQAALHFSGRESIPRGRLRIGGVESVCTALLPQLLLEFYQRCPQVEVVIKSGTTGELLDLAASNELDLVLTLDEKVFRPDLCCETEKKEEIIFVTLPGTYNQINSVMSIMDLCRQPFILTETGAAYRYELERMLAERELEINPILEIGNTETIINLLKKGMGISYLPRFTVADALQNGSLVQLHTDLPSVYMRHQLIRYKSKLLTRQMEIFMDLLKEFFQKNESYD